MCSSLAMADLPSSTYKDVWKAIASILHQSVDLSQTLFSAEEFAGILNTHVVSRDSVDAISDDLIKASLSNGVDKEYSIPLNCLPLGYTGDDVLYIYSSSQRGYGGKRFSAIGRFTSVDQAKEATINRQSSNNCFLGVF